MSCEVKNENCPFEIACLFPTVAQDKGSFSLYFYPSEGSPEQVAGCAYNGKYKCFQEEGFVVSHKDYNDVTITVPDTFATRGGSFGCQKGDIPMDKHCVYPPPEICNTGISLVTSTHTTDSSLSGDFGNVDQDDITSIVGAIIGVTVAVVVVSLILVIGICLFRRHRKNKSLRTRKISEEYKDKLSDSASQEYVKSLLPSKTTDNRMDLTQIDCESATFIGVNMRATKASIWTEQVSTINGQMGNVEQKDTSTDSKMSGASSGLLPTPAISEMIEGSDVSISSRCRLSPQNHASNKPLL